MHDAQNRKDFALSPLYGFWRSPADQRIHVNPGQEGWLRLSLLDERLFGVFMQHLLAEQPARRIRLGSVSFAITEVLGSPGSHPWVGYATIDQLQALDERPLHAGRWNSKARPPFAGARPTTARAAVESLPPAAPGHCRAALAAGTS